MEPRGQNAVDAIASYESMLKTLDISLQMALEANDTMNKAMMTLRSVSTDQLNTKARTLWRLSEQLLQDVVATNSTLYGESLVTEVVASDAQKG